MGFLAKLLSRQIPGPRWEVTRDAVRDQPRSVAEIVDALKHDLQLLNELMNACGGNMIDTRITIEHIVLLIGRLIPALNTVVADLYMTDVSELEHDDTTPSLPDSFLSLRGAICDLQDRWLAFEQRDTTDARERTNAAMEIALTTAELNVVCIRALNSLLLSRLD